MTLDPIYVKCTHCGAYSYFLDAVSGNTFGAEFWSDGFVFGSMLPNALSLIKCFSCNNYFWTDHPSERIYDWDFDKIRLTGVKYTDEKFEFDPFEPSQAILFYKEAIEQGVAQNKEQEFYLRLKLWQSINDITRYEYIHAPTSVYYFFRWLILRFKEVNLSKEVDKFRNLNQENLKQLNELLSTQPDDLMLKVEINRHLGNFDEATRWLKKIARNSDTNSFIRKQKCLLWQRNKQVFKY